MQLIITPDEDTETRLRACGKRYGVDNLANLTAALLRAALARDEIINGCHGGQDPRIREALTGHVSVRERIDQAWDSAARSLGLRRS